MRTPARFLAGHIMFTRLGVPWATWRLRPLQYRYAPEKIRRAARLVHQDLFQRLRGEALLLGVSADIEPASVVQRMIDGISLEQHPEWLEIAERTLDSLEQQSLGERSIWLAVPLATSVNDQLTAARTAISADFRSRLSLPPTPPSAEMVDRAMRKAERIESSIPAALAPRRATEAQQLWLSLHMQLRGLGVDGAVPASAQSEPRLQSAGFLEPWLDEGAVSDVQPRERFALPERRVLKVGSAVSDEASYQVTQVLSSAPKGGWAFPGGEWMLQLSDMPFDVDWAMRLRVVPAAAVRRRNQRAEKNLTDQYDQQSGDENVITGGASSLDEIARDLAAYHRQLNATKGEVEVQSLTLVTTSAATSDLARKRAKYVRDEFRELELYLEPVVGAQRALWWMQQPGTPLTSPAASFMQLSTGADLATTMPITSSQLGSDNGFPIGRNITTGHQACLLFNPAEAISGNMSGSFAAIGELGAGKSVFIKSVLVNVLKRGGAAVVVDRTSLREYARVMDVAIEGGIVVDLLRPQVSLDPLRMFDKRVASRATQTLFTALLNLGPFSSLGVELAERLAPEYLATHGIDSLGALLAHLSELEDPSARELARLINVIARKDIGEVLFDASLPPLDITASAGVAFCTSGLQLPTEADLERPETMSLEKIVGHAMYALIAELGREICFTRVDRLGGFFVDECDHMLSTPRGAAVAKEFILDGRKHGAFCGLAGQVVSHLGPPEVRGLIPVRVAFRQQDRDLALQAADWIGLDDVGAELIQTLSPVDEGNVVVPGRDGEAMFRDARARLGRVQIDLPEADELREAILTTPQLRDAVGA